MGEKSNNLILKILLKTVSVVLTVVFLLSTLGAVAITGVRHFLGDGEFETMVNETDLNEVKFTTGGKTYVVSDYIYEAVTEFLPSSVKNFSSILGSLFGNTLNNAIKEIISSDTVNAIVKTTTMECVDYYLNSDVNEAKERLKNDTQAVDDINIYENVKTAEEAVRIYVRSLIINTVENKSGISSDLIIVLLSKNTANLLIFLAFISAIFLVICNLGCLFDLSLHFGAASLAFGVVIKVLQSKFESSQTDKTLIGYQILKPLVDSFSPNATAGIVCGILLIAVFFILLFLHKPKDKTKA